jgi:hypothetical protein
VNIKSFLFAAVTILISTNLLAQESAQESKERAVNAAEAWLLLVDQEKYAESWESSASLFRERVTKDQWIQSMDSIRKTFGNVSRRAIKLQEYTTNMPGAPDGHYVIIQYDTSFEKKQSAVETITPLLDSDGQWRVSGYFIR